jgi:hypothetical protein
MRLLLSPSVLRHNDDASAISCDITLWLNRLSWVLAHPAEPLILWTHFTAKPLEIQGFSSVGGRETDGCWKGKGG